VLPVAILAGGLATRLRSNTATIPKALLPIQGEPFIAHQLRLLQAQGIERVVLCLGYLGEMVRDYVAEGHAFGLSIAYSWDGPALLGTAGAIRKALPLLGEAFFVLYGDSYLLCNYRTVQDAFVKSGKNALMTVFRNEGQWGPSNVEFQNGRIIRYDKQGLTPDMRHIDYGLNMFRPSAFAVLPDEPADLVTVCHELLARNELAAFEVCERFYEAGSFEGIKSLSEVLANPEGLRRGAA
jgi:N-acetyl-alpha-D-muramate 1-phosphate uridylyltransferase